MTNTPNSPRSRGGCGPGEAAATSVGSDRFDVAVIGAGQAGLAIGYFLARQGRRFVILEAADAVGAAWRDRWDSLVLFTPRRYDALPGLAFPGDPDGYPTRDEVIAYLEQYAATFDLPIEFNSAVRSLTPEDGAFRIEVDGRRVVADQVVVATGPFQQPDCRRSPGGSRLRSSRRTAPATAGRATSRTAASSSSAAVTPASRSPRSCRRATPSSLRSARARRRCRRSSSAATSSGG